MHEPGGGGFYHDFYHDAQHDPGVFGHDPSAGQIQHGSHYGVDGSGLGHHAGHQQGQGFDSKNYAGAFGGQAHHHGGILAQLLGLNQGHSGHSGGILAQLLGLNTSTNHHGLLATFLGLDTKHHYAHQTPPEVTRQGQFLWENLGRVFKHNLFNEFELTPGVLFFGLIAAMIGWLFVLNFTRHNEPQVNAMLGANVAQVAAYESSSQLNNHPSQGPIELPTNNVYSFYLQPNKFTMSRMMAKEGQGFVTQGQASPITVEPAVPTGVLNQGGVVSHGGLITQNESNGTSAVKTADGRIQTIVDR